MFEIRIQPEELMCLPGCASGTKLSETPHVSFTMITKYIQGFDTKVSQSSGTTQKSVLVFWQIRSQFLEVLQQNTASIMFSVIITHFSGTLVLLVKFCKEENLHGESTSKAQIGGLVIFSGYNYHRKYKFILLKADNIC